MKIFRFEISKIFIWKRHPTSIYNGTTTYIFYIFIIVIMIETINYGLPRIKCFQNEF